MEENKIDVCKYLIEIKYKLNMEYYDMYPICTTIYSYCSSIIILYLNGCNTI